MYHSITTEQLEVRRSKKIANNNNLSNTYCQCRVAVDPLFHCCHQWLKYYRMPNTMWCNHCLRPVQMAKGVYIMPSLISCPKKNSGTKTSFLRNITAVSIWAWGFFIYLYIFTWFLIPCRSTQIKTYSWDNAQVVLAGNKCDMEEERVVSVDSGRLLAEQLGKCWSNFYPFMLFEIKQCFPLARLCVSSLDFVRNIATEK